jgi:hypothetical protein
MYAFTREDDEPDMEELTARYRHMRDDMLKRNFEASHCLMTTSNRKAWRVQAEIAERELERRAIEAE